MIAFSCPACGKQLKVKDELAGRKGKCPACGQAATVPAAGKSLAAARADPDKHAPRPRPAAGEEPTLAPRTPALPPASESATLAPSGPAGTSEGPTLVPGNSSAVQTNAHAVPGGAGPTGLADFLAPAQGSDEIGRLGPYRVLKVLGHGGMGVVFKAEDPGLLRLVALKAMLPAMAATPTARERFFREARAAAALKHPHIVTIHQVGEDQGAPFLAMEFLDGEPLDVRLQREGKLPVAEVLRIGREVALGLACAHEKGLIHRDIKPANVWLEGKQGHAKILDFGLARALADDTHLTQSGAIIGTPAFMAPEQAGGKKVDHRCDLFSLGAMLYRMCTGELPFKGDDTISILSALALDTPEGPASLNPEVPAGLSELIMRLLAKEPEGRPGSAQEVADALRELAQSADRTEVLAAPRSKLAGAAAAPAREKPGRPWVWPAAGLAALLAVTAGGAVVFLKNRDGTETKVGGPDGGKAAINDPGGKPLPTAGPDARPPVVTDPDRRAAEWVLSLGGTVRVNGREAAITAAADLPKDRFTLTYVLLSNTAVTDAGLAHLKDLKGLAHLWLYNTAVTDAGLVHLKDLTGLMYLDLGRTKVTDAGLAHLEDLKRLGHLGLPDTQVSDAGLACLRELDIRHLWLGQTRVTDAGLAHIKEFKELSRLYMENTAVTDAGLAHLKELKVLLELGVSGTRVTDAGLASLKDVKSLIYLGVRKTGVTAKGLEDFRAAVPGCKIEHDGGTLEAKK